MEAKKRGRKKGTKNSTLSMRRQVADAHASNAHGLTTASCADHFRVPASTAHSWISTDVAIGSGRDGNAISVPRKKQPRATLLWLRSLVRDGDEFPTVAAIQQQMALLEPAYAANAGYSAIRKAAERVRLEVLKESNGYIPITRSIGEERIPAAKRAPRCTCRGRCEESCSVREAMHECDDDRCQNGPDCGNRKIQLSVAPAMETRDCGQSGFGMFAKQVIQKGQFVQEYVGLVVDAAEQTELRKRGRGLYIMELDGGFYVDAMHQGNASRFFNHSHASNCRAELWWVKKKPRVGIFATKVIQAGKELTINYGAKYRIDNCACSKCRK